MKNISLIIALWLLSFPVGGTNTQYLVHSADVNKIEDPLIGDPSDFDPSDPFYERYYDEYTGEPIDLGDEEVPSTAPCYRSGCPVWARVSIASQRLYLYVNGRHEATWLISSGLHIRTKTGDFNPVRVYDRWDSTRYPEGDYNGLGNMPYAMFYYRGFAIHGTPKGNWPKLGKPASHGCIRLHPDNAFRLNRLVRAYGLRQSWFTVQ